MRKEIWFKFSVKWHRFTHWEFWPMWAIYLPCVFYYIWISIKSGSFGFFKAVNPSILHGGMTLEDKNFVNQLLPQKYRAKSFFVSKKTVIEEILKTAEENNLEYPVIMKPNNGCRGRNVELIHNRKQMKTYLQKYGNEDILLEDYVSFPQEIGVFYVRYPNERSGFISGIVEKKCIEVVGDGKKDVEELIRYNLRYHNFYPDLFHNSSFDRKYIPKENERLTLSSIGNHARGATFYNASHKISQKLEDLFNDICIPIEGFYYGRFDVKFNSWDELEKGENFKIIELNGAASEPTYIYDPQNSYFFGIKEIVRHWEYMYRIARINKQKGYHFTDFDECWVLAKKFLKMPNY